MNPPTNSPSNSGPADEDLAEQGLPGHGIPSQDPTPAAQTALDPAEAEREAKSVLMGGGAMAGVAAGATVGVVVGGPVGVVVGATLGAVVGALGSAAAGAMVNLQEASGAAAAPMDGVRRTSKTAVAAAGRWCRSMAGHCPPRHGSRNCLCFRPPLIG